MSMSKTIHDTVVTALKTLPEIKQVYIGVVPSPAEVKRFPAIAIDFAVTRRKEGIVLGTMETEEEIDIYLYNTQRSNKYDDILSDLVKLVDSTLQFDSWLKDNCINNFIKDVYTDGGILHPRRVAKLTFYVRYIERK